MKQCTLHTKGDEIYCYTNICDPRAKIATLKMNAQIYALCLTDHYGNLSYYHVYNIKLSAIYIMHLNNALMNYIIFITNIYKRVIMAHNEYIVNII